MSYYRIEPWGEERADVRSGIVSSTVANFSQGKGNRTFRPADFMPKLDEDKPMSTRELSETLDAFMARQNRAR